MLSNKFIQRFVKASQIVFLTGNRLKTDDSISGNIFTRQKFSFKEQRDANPEEFWQSIARAREKYARRKPNLGHYALVDLEHRFEDFTLITTSIDGLHVLAGNRKLIELKGNLFRNRCLQCNHVFEQKDALLPICPECGSGDVLPDVLQEKEMPDAAKLKEAQRVSAEAEVFVTAGFNDANKDIKALPFIAKANGAYLLEINRQQSEFSSAMDEMIEGNPAKLLTAIVLLLEKIQ